MTRPDLDLTLYVVADARDDADRARLPGVVAAAVAGGATCVQVRDKTGTDREVLALVRSIVSVASVASVAPGVAVLVNDRVGVFLAARELGFPIAGVHVGQDDLPVPVVRRLLGPDAVIGVSASRSDDLVRAADDGADHVGIGALRDTATKPDAPVALGLSGMAKRLAACSLPAVVIGGVRPDDAAGLRAAGAAGMAVSSGICRAVDPEAAARTYLAHWSSAGGAA